MPAEFGQEADLIVALRRHLLARRFVVVEAVPTLNRCIDLVAWRGQSCSFRAIECKLRDWRRGLTQAERYRWGAPYVWLCLPLRAWPEGLRAEAGERGVGVLLCGASGLRILVRPRKSQVLWRPAEEWLKRAVERRLLLPTPSATAHQPTPPFLESTEGTSINWL